MLSLILTIAMLSNLCWASATFAEGMERPSTENMVTMALEDDGTGTELSASPGPTEQPTPSPEPQATPSPKPVVTETPMPTPGPHVITVNVTGSDTAGAVENAVVVIYPVGSSAQGVDAVIAQYVSNGDYTATGFRNGTYEIMVSAPGYLDLETPRVVSPSGGSMVSIREEIVLTKDSRITLSGVVKDARQSPVAGMKIVADKNLESAPNGVCDQAADVTDEHGCYTLTLDSDADYTLTLSQNGKTYLVDELSKPAQSEDANYTLEGFYLTTVVLEDEYGTPAVMDCDWDVQFRPFQVSVGGIPAAIRTDEHSAFQFLGTVEPCHITVISQGQFFEKTAVISDCSLQEEPFVIQLQEIILNIVVKDEAGEPVTLIDYRLINDGIEDGHSLVYENTAYREEGTFPLKNLDASAKSIQLIVTAEGYASVQQQIKLRQSGPLDDIEIVLKRGTATIKIIDDNVNPISGCTVISDNPAIKISGGGNRFRLTNIPVGKEFSLCITNSKYETQVFHTLIADEEPRELTCYITTLTSSLLGTLSGKVTDSGARPVEGALVQVGDLFTYTDKNGSYSLAQIPVNRRYDLSVSKEGYVTVQHNTVYFDSSNLKQNAPTVSLPEAKKIVLKVYDDNSGHPITNAKLTTGEEEKVTSYGDGTYELSGIKGDTQQVSIGAPGYLSNVVTLQQGQSSVTLAPAPNTEKAVEGFVRDTNGLTIAGAFVTLSGQTALTDTSGAYHFYAAANSDTKVEAQKTGYETAQVSNAGTYVDILLKPRSSLLGRIEGVVTDEDGKPVEFAKVELYYLDGQGKTQVTRTVTTTSLGGFAIPSLTLGDKYQLRIRKDGSSAYHTDVVADGGTRYYRLYSAGTYTMTVKNAVGQPVGGVDCYIPDLDRHYTTDAEGVVTIDGLVYDKSYDIYLLADGYMPAQKRGIRISANNPSLTGTTVLATPAEGKVTLSGTVTDLNTGAPIAGAVVTCNSVSGFTDSKGYYRLQGLTKSSQVINVSVSKNSYTVGTETNKTILANAENTLNITMERDKGSIKGKVLDFNNQPLPGVYVSADGWSTTTSGDGSYELSGVSVSKSVTVTFTKMGYLTGTAHVNLSKTKPEEDLPPYIMDQNFTAIIYLQDSKNGASISGATVELVKKDTGVHYKLTPFSDSYRNDQVPSGEYKVSIVSSYYYSPNPAPEITIPTDSTTTIKLDPKKSVNPPGGGGGGGGGGPIGPVVTPIPTATPLPAVTPTPPATATPPPVWQGFQDMQDPNFSWAVEPVTQLVHAGVIAQDDNFRPNDNIKREEFVKMLVVAFNLFYDGAQCNFTDAAAGDWYYDYVASAAQAGILNGYEDGRFGAGEQISRQDMAVLSYRAAQISGRDIPIIKEPEVFTDQAAISGYAQAAVLSMQCAGIINGLGDGTFAPRDNATRAQAAKIMYGLWSLPRN